MQLYKLLLRSKNMQIKTVSKKELPHGKEIIPIMEKEIK